MTSRITPLLGTGSGPPRWAGRQPARRRSWPQRRARARAYQNRAAVHLVQMLWFAIFFLGSLRIPAVCLGYVIWWAVKDPPDPGTDLAYDRASPDGEDG